MIVKIMIVKLAFDIKIDWIPGMHSKSNDRFSSLS